MPKQRYDLVALKKEFMDSEFAEARSFLVSKWLVTKINSIKTKWRAKEKRENKEKVLQKATEKAIIKQANALEIPMDQLTLAKKNAVVKVINKMMDKDLDMSDLERTIKILRTEMWLPTSYSKNENTNIEKIEWIHIVMGWNLIDNEKNDKNNA